MDLALNNLQRLICHKTNQTKLAHGLSSYVLILSDQFFHLCLNHEIYAAVPRGKTQLVRAVEYVDCISAEE